MPHPTDLEALGSPKQIDEEEAPPQQVEEEEALLMMGEEVQHNIVGEQSPSTTVTEVLSELAPQEEMGKTDSGDKGESSSALVMTPDENE